MEGYVKLTCTDDGDHGQIEGEARISHVSVVDKFRLVDALMQTLKMGSEERTLYSLMSANGFLEKGTSSTMVDAGAIEKAKEARDEHSGDKT